MPDNKTPQIFENYEIRDLIGKGHFAEVFLAVKRDLGREVALKILLPAWNDNEAVRGQFMEQAKLIARLRHPRIVEALDLGEENGTACLWQWSTCRRATCMSGCTLAERSPRAVAGGSVSQSICRRAGISFTARIQQASLWCMATSSPAISC